MIRWCHGVGWTRIYVKEIAVFLGGGFGLQAPGSVYPHVSLADVADRAALDQFHDAMVIVASVYLSSHLGDDAGPLR